MIPEYQPAPPISLEETPEVAPDEPEYSPPTIFPLSTSHVARGNVNSATVCIGPTGCKVLTASNRIRTDIGADQIAANQHFALRDMASNGLQAKAAEALVKRARAGDQNSMAIIARVRDNARAGITRAIVTEKLMRDYISKHPASDFGAEINVRRCDVDDCGAVMLANGTMSNEFVTRIARCFPSRPRALFLGGLRAWQDKHDSACEQLTSKLDDAMTSIVALGRTLGYAIALCTLRRPETPIAAFDSDVAWELGE